MCKLCDNVNVCASCVTMLMCVRVVWNCATVPLCDDLWADLLRWIFFSVRIVQADNHIAGAKVGILADNWITVFETPTQDIFSLLCIFVNKCILGVGCKTKQCYVSI